MEPVTWLLQCPRRLALSRSRWARCRWASADAGSDGTWQQTKILPDAFKAHPGSKRKGSAREVPASTCTTCAPLKRSPSSSVARGFSQPATEHAAQRPRHRIQARSRGSRDHRSPRHPPAGPVPAPLRRLDRSANCRRTIRLRSCRSRSKPNHLIDAVEKFRPKWVLSASSTAASNDGDAS